MEFLLWLENSGFAIWVREADYLYETFPYTFLLSLHAIGLAIVVGPNAAIDLRILGFASTLPLAPMERFFGFMWAGFWINAVSGVLLVPTDAATFLTDPIFYIKLGAIAAAVVNLWLIRRHVFRGNSASPDATASARGKTLAATSLALWTLAIFAGRMMAYDGTVRWATLGIFLLTATAVVAVVWVFVSRGGSAAARVVGWNKPVRPPA